MVTNNRLELLKCKNNLVYFAEHYCTVVNCEGETTLKLRKYQKRFLTKLQHSTKKGFVLNGPRQTGKTVSSLVYVFWKMLFRTGTSVALVSDGAGQTQTLLSQLKLMYERLPDFMKTGVYVHHEDRMMLSNTSTAYCVYNVSKAIGKRFDLIYVDEAAYLDANFANDLEYCTIPTSAGVSKNFKVLFTSTTKSDTDIFARAIKRKDIFDYYKIEWWEAPGRDKKWLKKMTREFGNAFVKREYKAEI